MGVFKARVRIKDKFNLAEKLVCVFHSSPCRVPTDLYSITCKSSYQVAFLPLGLSAFNSLLDKSHNHSQALYTYEQESELFYSCHVMVSIIYW
jgi:hypothetical protein